MTDQELAEQLGAATLALLSAYRAKVRAACAGSAASLLAAMAELDRAVEHWALTAATVKRVVGILPAWQERGPA